jgi:H+/Na+-translocating ferredoxin:NAD+ oxidoreductase subunit G
MSEDKNDNVPQITEEKEPSSFKLIMALGIAGLISGIILVGTYIYTDPLIKANKAEAIQKAIFEVLPECESFTTLVLEGDKLVEKNEDEGKEEESNAEELVVYAGFNAKKELIGFAIPGSEPGFQDIIATIFGYDGAKEVIIGFEVLESKETPGLGDKIFKDVDFQTNFTALAVEPDIAPVKKGEKQNPNEVETITGATISSKAVIRLLNKTMVIWKDAIDKYLEENNLNVAKK